MPPYCILQQAKPQLHKNAIYKAMDQTSFCILCYVKVYFDKGTMSFYLYMLHFIQSIGDAFSMQKLRQNIFLLKIRISINHLIWDYSVKTNKNIVQNIANYKYCISRRENQIYFINISFERTHLFIELLFSSGFLNFLCRGLHIFVFLVANICISLVFAYISIKKHKKVHLRLLSDIKVFILPFFSFIHFNKVF